MSEASLNSTLNELAERLRMIQWRGCWAEKV